MKKTIIISMLCSIASASFAQGNFYNSLAQKVNAPEAEEIIAQFLNNPGTDQKIADAMKNLEVGFMVKMGYAMVKAGQGRNAMAIAQSVKYALQDIAYNPALLNQYVSENIIDSVNTCLATVDTRESDLLGLINSLLSCTEPKGKKDEL